MRNPSQCECPEFVVLYDGDDVRWYCSPMRELTSADWVHCMMEYLDIGSLLRASAINKVWRQKVSAAPCTVLVIRCFACVATHGQAHGGTITVGA